jgi:Uma2 family endonuclease
MATAEVTVVQAGPACNGMLLEPAEFDAAEFEDGWRYELINGVLVVSPSPLREERDPNEELAYLLRKYQKEHPNGSALNLTVSEETVHVGSHRRRVDRAIWAGLGRLPDQTETPTIAVEFVSAGKRSRQRDYETKRDEYQSAGVSEYWIIDRFARQMTVYRFEAERTPPLVTAEGSSYTTPLLPGFVLPLDELLRLADRWSDVGR